MTASTTLMDFPFSLQQYATEHEICYTLLTGHNVTRHVLPKHSGTIPFCYVSVIFCFFVTKLFAGYKRFMIHDS